MRPQIVHALPASGKSTLVSERPYEFADLDSIVLMVTGQKNSKDTAEMILGDSKLKESVIKEIKRQTGVGRTVLMNTQPSAFGLEGDLKVSYGDDYVSHIENTDRNDLLENFSEEELHKWSTDYAKQWEPGEHIVLEAGQFLSDIL